MDAPLADGVLATRQDRGNQFVHGMGCRSKFHLLRLHLCRLLGFANQLVDSITLLVDDTKQFLVLLTAEFQAKLATAAQFQSAKVQ